MLLALAVIGTAAAEDLSVSSNVRGATILIDGVDTGFRTPAVISGLSPGSVHVEVVDQCKSGEGVAQIAAGKPNRITVDAAEKLATLLVEVTPAQAVVDVNHGKVKLAPNIPIGLPCGTYEIAATLAGYSSASYSLELAGGQELTLPITLDKLAMSTVEITVRPSAAAIYFDGREMGKDAVSLPSVYEGEHTLGARLKGYNDAEATIVVAGGDNLMFSVELARGDNDSEVKGVGGAGRASLSEGAKVVMDRSPAGASTSHSTSKSKAPPDDERLAEAESEPDEASERDDGQGVATPRDEPEDPQEPTEPTEPDDGSADEEDNLDEVPEEVAEPKSWSELHSESGSSTASRSSTSSTSKTTVKPKNSKAGLRAAGGTMLAVGALVAGGGGAYTYLQAADAYALYNEKLDAAGNASDDGAAERLRTQADEIYASTFQPKATAMYATLGVGGLVGATGLLLLVIDADGPVVVPAPGGGALVGWSGSF
jgi:hypothetical protein